MTADLGRPKATTLPRFEDDAKQIESLAQDSPLKLVAHTIYSMGGRAKSAEIREKLEGRLGQNLSWETWWKRVLPAVRTSYRYFSYKVGRPIVLRTQVGNIPDESWHSLPDPTKRSKKKSPLVRDWQNWFKSVGHEPPPGRFPTKPAIKSLSKLDAKDIKPALERILWGAERYLQSDTPTPHSAVGWSEAISRGFERHNEFTDSHGPNSLPTRVGHLLAILFIVAFDANGLPAPVGSSASGDAERLAELVRLGWAFPATSRPWREEFATGIWTGWQDPRYARVFFETSYSDPTLSPRERKVLGEEIISSGLRHPGEARKLSEFDRILDRLPPVDRTQILLDLMVDARVDMASRNEALAYIGRSRHAAKGSSSQRLDLMIIGSLLLSDGQNWVIQQASEELVRILTVPDGERGEQVWDRLLAQIRKYVDDLRREHRNALKDNQRNLEELVEEHRGKQDNLRSQLERLQYQIATNREEARMDILQDTVTVITETLQDFRHAADDPDAVVRNFETRLMLALRVAGAEEFGTVGEVVPYDPVRHRSAGGLSAGSPVRISASGVAMIGKAAVARILVKADVENL